MNEKNEESWASTIVVLLIMVTMVLFISLYLSELMSEAFDGVETSEASDTASSTTDGADAEDRAAATPASPAAESSTPDQQNQADPEPWDIQWLTAAAALAGITILVCLAIMMVRRVVTQSRAARHERTARARAGSDAAAAWQRVVDQHKICYWHRSTIETWARSTGRARHRPPADLTSFLRGGARHAVEAGMTTYILDPAAHDRTDRWPHGSVVASSADHIAAQLRMISKLHHERTHDLGATPTRHSPIFVGITSEALGVIAGTPDGPAMLDELLYAGHQAGIAIMLATSPSGHGDEREAVL